MSRLVVLALAAVVMLAAVPAAFAQEAEPSAPTEGPTEAPTEVATEEPTQEPVDPAPVACQNTGDVEVVTPDGLQTTIATPTFDGSGYEYKDFLVDLSATSVDATAPVTVTLTWELPVNDYDLAAFSERSDGMSDNYQPFDPAEETVTVVAGHCEVIEVQAINFLAPVDLDTLTLDFAVGSVTHPVPAAE